MRTTETFRVGWCFNQPMPEKHDTDTPTRIDLTPDAPTLRQSVAGSARHSGTTRVHTRARVAPEARRSGQTNLVRFLLTVIVALLMVVAFLGGQATRKSQAEIDRSIDQAVATARQSAVNSYRQAFDKLQAEAAAAVEAARKKGLADGRAESDARAEERRSVFDRVTDCVLRGQC